MISHCSSDKVQNPWNDLQCSVWSNSFLPPCFAAPFLIHSINPLAFSVPWVYHIPSHLRVFAYLHICWFLSLDVVHLLCLWILSVSFLYSLRFSLLSLPSHLPNSFSFQTEILLYHRGSLFPLLQYSTQITLLCSFMLNHNYTTTFTHLYTYLYVVSLPMTWPQASWC